ASTRSPSDHVCQNHREPLREFLPHQRQYEDAFGTFEYFLSLAFVDQRRDRGAVWSPVGSFAWRQRRREDIIYDVVARDAAAGGEAWGLQRGPLFKGSAARFSEVRRALHKELLQRLPW